MEELPIVSVIVPVYKVEKYLKRCLDSIIGQTYKNLDIVLVDDGSPDASPEICDDYAGTDDRIKVLHTKNSGPSAARNRGIKTAVGIYYVFIDSDDFMELDTIERWVKYIEQFQVDMVIGSFAVYYGNNGKENDNFLNLNNLSQIANSEEVLKEMFLTDTRICVTWGKMYHKNLFKDITFPEDVFFAEDMFIAHLLIDRADKIYVDKQVSFYYNQEGVSLCRSQYKFSKLARGTAMKEWMDFAENNYQEIYEGAFALYYKELLDEYILIYLSDLQEKKNYLEQHQKMIRQYFREVRKNRYLGLKDKIKSFVIRYHADSILKLAYKVKDNKRVI